MLPLSTSESPKTRKVRAPSAVLVVVNSVSTARIRVMKMVVEVDMILNGLWVMVHSRTGGAALI